MISVSTHVLDTSRGTPAAGVHVSLHRKESGAWIEVTRGTTDADGRVPGFVPSGVILSPGTYRMRFETGPYLDTHHSAAFFPHVEVVCVLAADGHYHLPLLLSPFGYSTYRGS